MKDSSFFAMMPLYLRKMSHFCTAEPQRFAPLLQSLGPRHVWELEAEEARVAQEHLVLLARQRAHHLNAALIDESSGEGGVNRRKQR